jgi:hypothetical protein
MSKASEIVFVALESKQAVIPVSVCCWVSCRIQGPGSIVRFSKQLGLDPLSRARAQLQQCRVCAASGSAASRDAAAEPWIFEKGLGTVAAMQRQGSIMQRPAGALDSR